MEEYLVNLEPELKQIIDELCAHVEKRTKLKPSIMFSIPAFKLTNSVMLAFDITKTYVGLYTTDQESIHKAKGRLENAIFGASSIKVDRTSREALEVLKDICDDVIMKYMVFNPQALISALDDKNQAFSDAAYFKLLEILEENEIPEIDYYFLLRHPKRDYITYGIGLLLHSLKYDNNHKYDGYLVEYFKLLDLPYYTTLIEAIIGLSWWIAEKPYLKQTIKNRIKTMDLSYFKETQQEKIKVEIEKILQL